jgi:hypothetical protein
VPKRVEYYLTDLVRWLHAVFDTLGSWGKAYMNDKKAAKENMPAVDNTTLPQKSSDNFIPSIYFVAISEFDVRFFYEIQTS